MGFDILLDPSYLTDTQIQEHLDSRARANASLQEYFPLHNPFVLSNRSFHDRFVAVTRQTLSRVNKASTFSRISAQCEELVNEDFGQPIKKLIQEITLSLVLREILEVEWTAEEERRVAELARYINEEWLAHKEQRKPIPLSSELQSFLDKIGDTSDYCQALQVNALSLIIPAFETSYRVIFYLLLTIDSARASLRHQFFHACERDTTSEVTLLHFISETLRLYPPVKRIYRNVKGQVAAVDVEALHCDPNIWDDPANFNPSRWLNLSASQRRCRLAFSIGLLSCPASNFSPKFLAAIVKGFVPVLMTHRLAGLDEGGEVNGLFKNDRISYGEARFRRVQTDSLSRSG